MKKLKHSCRGLLFVFSSTLVFGLGAMTVLESQKDAVDNYLGTHSTVVETHNDGTLFSKYKVDNEYLNEDGTANTEKVIAAHKALGRQMSAEGSVLLKNEGENLPLKDGHKKVTLFGVRSSKLISGSFIGHKASPGQTVSFKDALQEDGVEVNPTMSAFYDKYCQDNKIDESGMPRADKQASVADINSGVPNAKDTYKEYGDMAIVVLGRGSSEGMDYQKSQDPEKNDGASNPMQLTNTEKALIKEAEDNFEHVTVVLNTISMMEIDELKNDDKIDSILWMGIAGNYGANGVADIISGKANPSGHLADVYAVNSVGSPAMQNFGKYSYANKDDLKKRAKGTSTDYVIEAEGIYTGYKYYETRYADSVLGKGNANGNAGSVDGNAWKYQKEMSYGFGYGLSYSTFKQEIVGTPKFTNKNHNITAQISVKVTNTGKVAGKDVVQVYGQAPYTDYDKEHNVEKSAIQLLGYGKTAILEPGASETVVVDVDLQNLASWDSTAKGGNGSYILDAGNHYFAIGNGAHDALNNILASLDKTTADGMDYNGDSTKVFKFEYPKFDENTFNVSKAGVKVKNSLKEADWNTFDKGKVTNLTRSDWNATFPKTYDTMSVTPDMAKLINGDIYNPEEHKDVEKPTFGKAGDLEFASINGLPYDDPRWDDLLDQLDLHEGIDFIYNGNRKWTDLESLGYVGGRAITENGPNGVGDRDLAVISKTTYSEDAQPDWIVKKDDPNAQFGMRTFPSATVVASTFNVELAKQQGVMMGNDALFVGLPILWGPSMNTHRTGYNGRNIEYYSEDPVLTGTMAMEYSIGCLDKGLIAAPKHFAFNDQETSRGGVAPYLTEQRGRENELRAFQIAFEATKYDTVDEKGNITDDKGLLGVMTSFSKIGPVEVTCSSGMLTDILRGEWGFKGYVVSDLDDDLDYFEDCVAAGITSFDAIIGDRNQPKPETFYEIFDNDPFLQQQVRDSVHRDLYILTQSNYANTLTTGTTSYWNMTWWRATYFSVIGISAALTAITLGVDIWLNCFKKDKDTVEEAK